MKWLLNLFLIFPLICYATVWKIVPKESQLTFTAIQNGAPVTGTFKTFSGNITFDPDYLDTSKIKIIVDIASLAGSYQEMIDALKTTDWFNVKIFPQAIFESTKIFKTGDKTYQAEGKLTIRDKTQPVILTFTQEKYTEKTALMKGKATIKRTAFGVGQGEWADTEAVKDNVQIDFIVSATTTNPLL